LGFEKRFVDWDLKSIGSNGVPGRSSLPEPSQGGMVFPHPFGRIVRQPDITIGKHTFQIKLQTNRPHHHYKNLPDSPHAKIDANELQHSQIHAWPQPHSFLTF